ncbi:DNA replication complex GINS protein SLD5 [Aphelenchoides bicaudatus]|nr:DNA replication complex GINS protein SLD5 [Aphelenchoides bicaudatus]
MDTHDDLMEQEDGVTLYEAVVQMKRFWTNERISKELLPHQFNYVSLLLEEIKSRIDQLDEVTDKANIEYGARIMDLERVQYIINSYIRVRLQKIEANAAAIVLEHMERQHLNKDDLLDERELTFAESFHNNRLDHFKTTFLEALPDQMKDLPVPRSSRNTRSLVHVTYKDGLESIPVFDMADPNNELLVDLEYGGTYLVPFNSIQEQLEKSRLDLL